MSSAPPFDRDDRDFSVGKGVDFKYYNEKTCSGRVRRIEERLGIRIDMYKAGTNDPDSHRLEYEKICLYDQSIRLLNAFTLIADARIRSDILALVTAAAQHKSEPD